METRQAEPEGLPDLDRTTLVLTASDVSALLSPLECIEAVEKVLGLQAAGEALPPGVLGLHTAGGGFHIKAAAVQFDRFYFAAKTNGNFPGNPDQSGLPTIQGVIVLCDAEDGRPLALLDSIEVTNLRTAAATAVAARHLARPVSSVVTIVGCGTQAPAQLRALAAIGTVEHVLAVDTKPDKARAFALRMSQELGVHVAAAQDLHEATRQSDIVVTCTPSRLPFLGPDDVSAGTFVAAVGADNPEKQEIDPQLFGSATVVVDSLDQCAAIGDLQHAIAAGVVTEADVHAELGAVVAGQKPGRTSDKETIIFDSTGTALQDVAAAALVYERAISQGRGHAVELAN